MTLADYVAVLRRSRLQIALVTILCAGIGLGFSLLQSATYTATASLTVREPGQDLTLIGAGEEAPPAARPRCSSHLSTLRT